MLTPHTPRTSLAIAMLVALAAFSAVACSTTATDPAPADADAPDTSSTDAGQSAMDTPDEQMPAADSGAADQGTSDPATSDTRSTATTREFTMHPGETTQLADNGSLRYLRMVNDSRCKPGVQCIWAGNAELSFQWNKPGGGQDTFSLNTNARGGATEHSLGSQRLTLVSLARGPAPEARLRVDPGS